MQLLKALEILGSSSEEQIKYLSELGTYPSTDELALQFDDTYKVFIANIDEKDSKNFQCEKSLEILANIDSALNLMSDKKVDIIWNVSSLNGVDWNNIRELSKKALTLISSPS